MRSWYKDLFKPKDPVESIIHSTIDAYWPKLVQKRIDQLEWAITEALAQECEVNCFLNEHTRLKAYDMALEYVLHKLHQEKAQAFAMETPKARGPRS